MFHVVVPDKIKIAYSGHHNFGAAAKSCHGMGQNGADRHPQICVGDFRIDLHHSPILGYLNGDKVALPGIVLDYLVA